MKTIQEQINDLRKKEPKVIEIVEACPYDIDKNIGGAFTEQLFMEKVFQTNDSYDEKLLELWTKFNKSISLNRQIFIHGFSGIGKSTFLNRFKWEYPEFDVRIIDFQNYIIKEQNPNVHAISEALKQFLVDERYVSQELLVSTFEAIVEHINSLSSFLQGFYNECYLVKDYSNGIDYNECRKTILNLDNDDIFIFYFLYLFNDRSRNNLKPKKCIIVFDNLDSLSLEYISSNFSENFSTILKNLNIVADRLDLEIVDKIDFVRNFKFIFCLRDGNFAELNANNQDKLFSNTEYLDLKLTFNIELYRNILKQRIQFAKEVCPQSELDSFALDLNQIQNSVDSIVSDYIFELILRPLFNNDFRKVSVITYISLFKEWFKSINISEEIKNHEYATRSLLIFSFIRKLSENNFIKLFTDILLDDEDEEQGYCNPMRLILILIINLCFKRISNQKELAMVKEDVPLFELLEVFDEIHTNELFFDILYKAFAYHRSGWVNLITIKNKSLNEIERFSIELKSIAKLKSLDNDTQDFEIQKERKKIISELNKIKIKLNPSGYTFLRYINPRFEYYSILANNKTPLFYEYENIKSGKYEFEKIIYNVLTIVKLHQKLMKSFFKSEFKEKRGIDENRFKLLPFSFKFYGSGHSKISTFGSFHILRILSFHLDHLGEFRLYVINKWKNIPEDELIKFNKKMYYFLNQYFKLLKNCIDPYSLTLVERIEPKIKKIKTSGFKDRTTEI